MCDKMNYKTKGDKIMRIYRVLKLYGKDDVIRYKEFPYSLNFGLDIELYGVFGFIKYMSTSYFIEGLAKKKCDKLNKKEGK